MEGYADLPVVVLELICSHLTVPELLQATQVCITWHALINNPRVWFKRLLQMDIQINPDLKSKLQGSHVNKSKTLSLLQGTCLYEEDVSSPKSHFGNRVSWIIEERDINVTSALLVSRTPGDVTVRLRSDPDSIRNIDIFFLVISYHSCDVFVEDLYCWRNASNSNKKLLKQICLSRMCNVKKMWTAVQTAVLPTTIRHLRLALLVNPTTKKTIDPGIAHLIQRFPLLQELGIHVRADMVTDHLPHLPYLKKNGDPSTDIYLSELSEDHHVQWAVNTMKTLRPLTGGYGSLVLPRCSLHEDQLYELIDRMAAAGVTNFRGIAISFSQGNTKQNQLPNFTPQKSMRFCHKLENVIDHKFHRSHSSLSIFGKGDDDLGHKSGIW
ncbi:unnamed protein product [Meganyctiphanes norvegica]|uniref:F-box domain-containing protein n=1 Tax=Meganyctiphanes norvegica TaxID=48144 RepID=A0AAV2RL00_MEGNR